MSDPNNHPDSNTSEHDYKRNKKSSSHNIHNDNNNFVNDDAINTRIGVEHVNWLIQLCGMNELYPVYDISECSSSLFVVLIQRVLHYRLSGVELEPDTTEKKLRNMSRVLEELESITQMDLSYIRPAEIVAGNEEHISLLVHVFLILVGYPPQGEVEEDDAVNAESRTTPPQNAVADHHHAPHHHHHHYSMDDDDGYNDEEEGVDDSRRRVYSVPPPAPVAAKQQPNLSTSPVAPPLDTNNNTNSHKNTKAVKNAVEAAETASSVSNADSANFTNQLVNDWKVGLVEAAPRAFGAGIDRLTLVHVKQRLDSLEKAIAGGKGLAQSRRTRPTGHDSRSRVVESFAERYQSARGGGGDVLSGRVTAVISRAQRDERTAAIRAVKTHRALQDEIRREIVRSQSLMEQRVLQDLKQNLKSQRLDYWDAQRRVRDECKDLTSILSNRVASIANDPKLHNGSAVTLHNQKLLATSTKHMVREHARATREAKRTVKQCRRDARDQLDGELRSYTRLHGALFALSPEDIV